MEEVAAQKRANYRAVTVITGILTLGIGLPIVAIIGMAGTELVFSCFIPSNCLRDPL